MGDSKRRKQLYGAAYYDHAQTPKRDSEDESAEVLMAATPREIVAEWRPTPSMQRMSWNKRKRDAMAARVKLGLPAKKLPVRGLRAWARTKRAMLALARWLRWCWIGSPPNTPHWTRIKRLTLVDEKKSLTPEQLQLVCAAGIGTSPSVLTVPAALTLENFTAAVKVAP